MPFVRYSFDMLTSSNYVLILINYPLGFLGLYLSVYPSKIYSKVLRTKLTDGNSIWTMEHRNKTLGEAMDFPPDPLYGLHCFLWKYVWLVYFRVLKGCDILRQEQLWDNLVPLVCFKLAWSLFKGSESSWKDGSIGKIFATQGCGPIFWIMDVVTEWHFSVVPTQLQKWEVEIKGS